MNQKIKAIIFDFGGIFTKERNFDTFAKKYSEKFSVDYEELLRIMGENWQLVKVNKIDSNVFWEKTSEYLKYNSEKLRKETIQFFGLRENMLKIAKFLKSEYKLALLTNQIRDWLSEMIKKYKLNDVFDTIVISDEVKLAKPDPRIYQIVLERMGLKPEQCLFIDDKEENIEAARKLKIKTILFENPKQLKIDLQKFGIEVS